MIDLDIGGYRWKLIALRSYLGLAACITPTASECAAYFRDATEPPPRPFSKLGER